MTFFRSTLAFSLVCLLSTTAMADNWPRFRGPNGSGIAEDAGIPTEWSEDDLAWKIQLPGTGHSSPVVWGENVYVTSANAETNEFSLLAFKTSNGELVWKRDYSLKPLRVHSLNSRATSTPAADDAGVYAIWFGQEQTLAVAVSHAGTELWTKDLGKTATMHGPSLSPLVYNGLLVFSLEHEINRMGLESHWYALDGETGETIWRLDRETTNKASSSVPCVYRTSDGTELLVFSSNAHGFTAVEPQTGKVAWEVASAFPTRVISSPVRAGDYIVGTSGVRGGGLRLIAIQPGDDASVPPTIVHDMDDKLVPYIPTPLAVDNLLFLFHDMGLVTCLDIGTGKVLWSERLKAKFFGSPVLVGDRIYCITSRGKVAVLQAAAEFKQLAMNDLGEASSASPAVAGGRMFLRTKTHLSCIAAPNAN